MKQLLVLTIFISSLIMSSVAHAKWTWVIRNVNGTTFYVDFQKIRKHDGKVYYWRLTDYLKPENGIWSGEAYIEAECGPFRQRFLAVSLYSGSMATGTEKKANESQLSKDWEYRKEDAVLEAVCNYTSMQ